MRERLGVVVGYEKSSSASRALMWGASEAAARGVPLTVCRVWEWPYHEWPGELVPLDLVPLDLARRPALRLVKEAAVRVGRDHPRLPVNTLVDRGAPEDVLADLSWDAQLVVLGSRGRRRRPCASPSWRRIDWRRRGRRACWWWALVASARCAGCCSAR